VLWKGFKLQAQIKKAQMLTCPIGSPSRSVSFGREKR
jgi:hypothetical protein